MAETDLDRLAWRVRGNVFVDAAKVDEVLTQHAAGALDVAQTTAMLLQIDRLQPVAPLQLAAREDDADWSALRGAMRDDAAAWQRIATVQYRQGFWLLPIAIVAVLGFALLASWRLAVPDQVVVAVTTAALAALGTHSYFVFRIHQQARQAAERLGEKRAAVYFLQAAMARTDPARLIDAATAMFLGHHAAPTLPLGPDDAPKGGAA